MKWTGIGGLVCVLATVPALAQPEEPTEQPPTSSFEPVDAGAQPGQAPPAAGEGGQANPAAEAAAPAQPTAQAAPAAGQPPPPPPGYAGSAAPGTGAPPPATALPPAGYGPPPPAPPPEPTWDVSLTLSPIHLLLPVLEVMGELRVVDHMGVSLLGGYGSATQTEESLDLSTGQRTTRDIEFSVLELGGQIIGYPLEKFESLQAGFEFLYVKIETDQLAGATVSGLGTGFAAGPLVGYKLITSGGFTFLAQGGVEYVVARAEVEQPAGTTASSSASNEDFIPLLNLNLGWSF